MLWKERARAAARSNRLREAMEAVEHRRMLAAHVVGDSTVYTTIQAAVDAAPTGGTVTVDAGTYQELVRLNKFGLTIKGALAGVDGRTPSRSAATAESVVRGEDLGGGIRSSAFLVTADDVTIDGFTVQDTNSNGQFGGGIVLGPDVDGSHVFNNIVKNNSTGLILANNSASDPAVIAHNLFLSNNLPGQHTGRAIYTDGGFTNNALTNVVIDDNTFTDNHGGEPAHSLEAAIGIEAQATSTQTNIDITNNVFDFNGKALLVTNASDLTITGNIVYNTRDTRSGALRFEGGVHDVAITGNTVYAGNARGIRIDNVGAPGPNFNFTITGNNLFQNGLNTALGVNHDALFVGEGQFEGQLDARNNWWGSSTGPSGDGGGTGDGLFANGNDVVFIPFATAPLDALQLPFFGRPVPGDSARIDFINFDRGGEGVAYHDVEATNRGGQVVRVREGVDVEKTTDPGSGFAVDFTRAGEFVEYTVDVVQSGVFKIDLRLASAQTTGGKFHVEVDGVDVTGPITAPNTGAWTTYNTITDTGLPLTAGRHVFRFAFDTGGSGGAIANFNWFKLTRTGALPTPAPAAPSELVATAAGTTSISLTWHDNADNESGFKLERGTDGTTFAPLATPGANATSFTDTGLTPGTKYFYRIRATNAGGDSDFSNVANATTATVPPVQQTVTYIATGATWKYLANGSNQGTAWRATGFNDSTWSSGAAELGYGDGDEATVVSFGPNSSAKFITTYFRKSFNVADATQVSALSLRIKRDDGAVVFLNGAEVFRTNMPTGTISNTTPASSAVEDNTFFTATINPALLVSGNNVIAVEIHQANQTSSDISFNFELKATVSQPATAPAAPSGLVATANGTNRIDLTWVDNANNESGFIVERSLDGSTGWTQVGTPGANATGFADTQNLSPATQYFYRVRATNAVGPSANSNTANATTAAAPTQQTVTYVPTGATWKYLDNGSNQGTAWRASGFDDSAWKSGAAQLGYGDGDEATVVGFGGNPDAKFITTYFRKTFTVADASQVKSLTLRLLRDDGAVVYLNGQEVVRDNIGTGDVGYTRLASTPLEDEAFHTFTLDPARLTSGTNTIAVEIHQGSASSSDISFDLELKAVVGDVAVPGALPAPWTSSDVGPVAAAGSASFANDTFTIAGDGTDIWGKSDSFRFAYQPLAGDGEIVARLAGMERKDLLAKAGVMVRESLAHDAKQASLFVTPANGARFIRRGQSGGASTSAVPGDHRNVAAPQWLRLVRSGNTITAYRSADGDTWSRVGSDTVSMSSTVFVGLAVTSHRGGVVNSATFDHVSVVS